MLKCFVFLIIWLRTDAEIYHNNDNSLQFYISTFYERMLEISQPKSEINDLEPCNILEFPHIHHTVQHI